MQRRNRDSNLFSMSAIDLFCSGMGAIMVLTVILMPYYLRPEAKDLLEQTRRAQEALARSEAENERLQQENAAMQSRLEKPFLVVAISWDNEDDDVDLHITDPQGREFYYKQRAHRGSPALLEVDSQRGPGNEVWLHPAATPGVYRLEYVFYADRRPLGPVKVRGVALYHEGRLPLPDRTLERGDPNRKISVADLVVSPDGRVTIR